MPVKPLPSELVYRLKKAARKLDANLGKMKNIDYRRNENWFRASDRSTLRWGERVRRMNVARNYPGTKLAIKRIHGIDYGSKGNAQEEIRLVKQVVRTHNSRHSPKTYELLEPHAYAIGKDLAAMARTNLPTVKEVLILRTRKRQVFFKKLKAAHDITEEQLETAYNEVRDNTQKKLKPGNLLLLGFKGKKFVFMPLIDSF